MDWIKKKIERLGSGLSPEIRQANYERQNKGKALTSKQKRRLIHKSGGKWKRGS